MGGDCLEDWDRLREDAGLAERIGHPIPSPEMARKFLYQFHADELMEQARQQRPLGQLSYIPGENQPLEGLGQVNRDLLAEVGRRCPDQKIATVDQDSTIIESPQREALPTYQGEPGYQPMLAVCGHPAPQTTGGVVGRRQCRETFRGADEPLRVAGGEAAAMASGEGRNDRSRA